MSLIRWMVPAGMVLLTAACGSASSASTHPSVASWSGATLQQAFPKPEFTLTDTQNQPYDFQAKTAGKVALLYFGYTHCPDVCPTNMATLATAMSQLPASVTNKIAVVFVTTDPARDTPPVIRAWLDQFNPTFVGLTGTPIAVAGAQSQSGLGTSTKEQGPNGTYGINHAAFILVYTPDNLAHLAFPAGMTPAAVKGDLQHLVVNGWSGSS